MFALHSFFVQFCGGCGSCNREGLVNWLEGKIFSNVVVVVKLIIDQCKLDFKHLLY